MKVLICIDDTDNKQSRGTGDLALKFATAIIENRWGTTTPITRHQLFVHEDIPYTSHNSAMCFSAEIFPGCLKWVIAFGQQFLENESAEGSDPGLCVVSLDELKFPEELVRFGQKAKTSVLTKNNAYITASKLGVHLSEHGGTGDGIIGALAGAGLRLSGNDGRLKGKYYLDSDNGIIKVKEICAQSNIDEVWTENGEKLDENESMMLGEKVKSVLLAGKIVLPVEPLSNPENKQGKAKWITLSRDKIRKY